MMSSSQKERASAVRQLAQTARDLLDRAKALARRSDEAPDGSPEKTALEEEARDSLTKARAIAESANKLAR